MRVNMFLNDLLIEYEYEIDIEKQENLINKIFEEIEKKK